MKLFRRFHLNITIKADDRFHRHHSLTHSLTTQNKNEFKFDNHFLHYCREYLIIIKVNLKEEEKNEKKFRPFQFYR